MQTEQTLIKNCQKGDKRSQYLLVERYSGMLATVCRRYARDNAMAKDMLQETLILIFTHIKKYKPTGSFEGWMRRIAVNCALQWIKRSYFIKETATTDFQGNEIEKIEHPVIFKQLAEEEIIRLMQTLPDGYRTILNLYSIEGFSHKEIAELLDISVNTSRSQLMRARKNLINKMNDFPNKISA